MAGKHWARKKIVFAINYDFKVNKTKIGNRKLKSLASDHTTTSMAMPRWENWFPTSQPVPHPHKQMK